MFYSCLRVIIACLTVILVFSASGNLAQAVEPGGDVQVTMSVDNATPETPQQIVEFTIEVKNPGESTAENVMVEDMLPPELAIPEGMTPTTSVGDYDPLSGIWDVGEIAPGDTETLVIPAVVWVSPQPACIINEAALMGDDDDNANNVSVVAIRLPGVESCTDLYPLWFRPVLGDNYCGGEASVSYEILVHNLGPEDASDVALKLTETSNYKLPGFKFVSDACSGFECQWQSIPAYQSKVVHAESITFRNNEAREHGIRLVVTTADEDYVPENNTSTSTRAITSFTTPCPDYGISDPPLIPDVGGGGCFISNLF